MQCHCLIFNKLKGVLFFYATISQAWRSKQYPVKISLKLMHDQACIIQIKEKFAKTKCLKSSDKTSKLSRQYWKNSENIYIFSNVLSLFIFF